MRSFKTYSVIIHLAGWVLFMAFPLLFFYGGDSNPLVLLQQFSYWLFCFSYIFLFYLNTFFLIPHLFLVKRYITFSIIILVLFIGIFFLKPFDHLMRGGERWHNAQTLHTNPAQLLSAEGRFFPRGDGWRGHHGPSHRIDFVSLFIFLMIVALSTAIKAVQQWHLTEQRAALAEADKASAELSFLKAQINPHFLFNTLNNIYTLAVTKNEYTAESIMKLSNIMRYVTDDVTEDFVPLKSEIDCISDYIELQRLRTGKNVRIAFAVTGNTDHKKIAPLVLMTFIENVFKYGVSKHEKCAIDISVAITGASIYFFCQNQIFGGREENKRTGIGITNTKQRLTYLYPAGTY
jgi:two-component system LytT family sensor kinase